MVRQVEDRAIRAVARRWVLGCLAALLAPLWASLAIAQEWPSRPVTLIVPFAAGSTPDIAARLVADRLQAKLGQPFVVENRPGASGNLGTRAVAQAKPDGYTIGVSIGGPLAINPLLYASMPYDPQTDLAFITILVSQPSVLAASKDSKVTSTDELIALIKREPGKVNFGSIGNGSISHLAAELIALKSGTKLTHLPYTGSPAVLTSLIRNDVQFSVLPAGSIVPAGRAGQVTLLAVTSAKRSALVPDLPTMAEAGVPGVEADTWIGLIAPAKVDPAILARLERAAREALEEPALRDKLKVQYMEAVGNTPQEFRALVQAEAARWKPVIQQNGIRLD